MTARAKPAKGGRGRGQTSKAIARTAKKNGAKGGRPRDRLPQAVVDDLGKIPTTEKEIRVWCSRVLGKVAELIFAGEISRELAAEIRATMKDIRASLPPARAPDDEGEAEDDDEGGSAGAELEDDEEEFDGVRA